MLPEVVEFFGARKFDTQIETAVSLFIVVVCLIFYAFVHFFLDKDLKWKKVPKDE